MTRDANRTPTGTEPFLELRIGGVHSSSNGPLCGCSSHPLR